MLNYSTFIILNVMLFLLFRSLKYKVCFHFQKRHFYIQITDFWGIKIARSLLSNTLSFRH
jgi:hypothetical protein